MHVNLSLKACFIWKVNKAAAPDDPERPLMIYDINWNSGQLSQFFIGLKETSRADGSNQAKSNLSRFITLFQAATKSLTNLSPASALP